MSRRLFLPIIINLLAVISLFSADEPPIINWYYFDYPPYYVTEKNNDAYQKGIHDLNLNLMIQEIPGYQHDQHLVNIRRMLMDMKHLDNACCASLSKSKEREEFLYYSEPAYIAPPNGLIVRNSEIKLLKSYLSGHTIDLKQILKDQRLHIGVTRDRVYRHGIDAIIEPYKNSELIHARPSADLFVGLLEMLHQNRGIDAILGSAPEVASASRRIGIPPDESLFLFVQQEPEVSYGYVACSKSKTGQQIINEVNKVIRKHRTTDFIDHYSRWLDSNTIHWMKEQAKQIP